MGFSSKIVFVLVVLIFFWWNNTVAAYQKELVHNYINQMLIKNISIIFVYFEQAICYLWFYNTLHLILLLREGHVTVQCERNFFVPLFWAIVYSPKSI